MTTIFLSPYKSELSEQKRGGCSKAYAPLHQALSQQKWPYDYGDDPSFFCRKHRGGALTWGICRADVRSQLQPGDIAVFFSFAANSGIVTYRLSAIATVQQKIPQSAIFLDPKVKTYRRYLNLLIKPAGGKGNWIHEEPAAPSPNEGHSDWLKRVAIYRNYSRAALEEQCAMNKVREGQLLDGKPFAFGANYVIFSRTPEHSLVLETPPIVAHSQPPRAEVWRPHSLSEEIWKQTFGQLRKHKPDCLRGLRLDNKIQQPSLAARTLDDGRGFC
jgi:hypothetical protein